MASPRNTMNGYEQTQLSERVQKVIADFEREHNTTPLATFSFFVAFVWGLGRRIGWDTGGMLGYATKAFEACDRRLGAHTRGLSNSELQKADALARGPVIKLK